MKKKYTKILREKWIYVVLILLGIGIVLYMLLFNSDGGFGGFGGLFSQKLKVTCDVDVYNEITGGIPIINPNPFSITNVYCRTSKVYGCGFAGIFGIIKSQGNVILDVDGITGSSYVDLYRGERKTFIVTSCGASTDSHQGMVKVIHNQVISDSEIVNF